MSIDINKGTCADSSNELTSNIIYEMSSSIREICATLAVESSVLDVKKAFNVVKEYVKKYDRLLYSYISTYCYNSKKLTPGDLYCIIIGEHCYDTEKYFQKISFKCDNCGASVETYYSRPICFSNYEVKHELFGLEEYKNRGKQGAVYPAPLVRRCG